MLSPTSQPWTPCRKVMEQGRAGNLAPDVNCSKSPEEISVGCEKGRGCPGVGRVRKCGGLDG